jgi:hypothetical protein
LPLLPFGRCGGCQFLYLRRKRFKIRPDRLEQQSLMLAVSAIKIIDVRGTGYLQIE